MALLHPGVARLGGRPLAIAPRALEGLLAVGLSLDARADLPPFGQAGPGSQRGYTVTDGGVALVSVLGPLVTRGDWLTELLGASDYASIGGTLEDAFADPSVRAVLLELDSPGGEVGGLFDLVDRVAALRAATEKPLWAVASESALSAAYAIASIADRLYLTRTAEVGSVGVVAVHVDESAADAMAGLKWTLIHAGARKVDGSPHEPLSGTAFAAIQTDVDALQAEFVTLVARNRRIAPDVVGATEAAVYRGQRGVDAGFADRLGTVDQALADLAMTLDPPRPSAGTPRRERGLSLQHPRRASDMTADTTTPATAEDGPVDETQSPTPGRQDTPAITSPAPVFAPAAPTAPADDSQRLRAEYAEIAGIAAQAGRLGVAIDAADAMARGIAPHALRRSVLDALATRSEANAVVVASSQPAAGPGSSGSESPIVRRARERAAAARG